LHVSEQHRHLLPLAFDRAAGGEDLLGEVLRGVRTRVACGRRGADRRGRRRPRERVLLSPGDALNVNQLLDDLLQRAVVQLNCRRSIRKDRRPFSSR
jgi:hypothetical protein